MSSDAATSGRRARPAGDRLWPRQRWAEPVAATLAAGLVAAIVGFYVVRALTPLPIFGVDAGSFLIRAIYPDPIAARDPYAADVTSGVQLSLIRAAWRIGASTGASYVLIDNAMNAGFYVVGLVALWWACVRGLAVRPQGWLLLLVLGFAYYRFPVTSMAEGPFVGALAGVALVTRAWWRRRPALHALSAGILGAVLVLIKPHGVAVVSALAALALIEAAGRRDWRRLLVRAGLFAAAFFSLGNLIQWAAEEPVRHGWAFFASGFYAAAVGARMPPSAAAVGAQAFAISSSAALVLVGAPAVIGLADLRSRRARNAAFQPKDRDVLFGLLLLALAATLVMVAVFAAKTASAPGETYRLQGRYFEFYTPMIWVAAAPALGHPLSRPVAIACGAVTLAGLAGLLALLSAGWIILPWDSTVLTAFF